MFVVKGQRGGREEEEEEEKEDAEEEFHAINGEPGVREGLEGQVWFCGLKTSPNYITVVVSCDGLDIDNM